jgi:hypothetical protein
MGIRISSLSANALPYTGREQIPLVQNQTTRAGTLSSFVNYLSGDFAFVNRPNTFLGSQTIQGNLSVQRTLSATMVEAVSAKFDFVDIKRFESSGFDVRGDLNVVGKLSATNNTTINGGLTAFNAVLFDVNSSLPALEVVQRGLGPSLVVDDEANDSTPFIIASDGKVGIGTPTPNETLTVIGNISATGNTTFIGGVTGSNPITIDVNTSTPALDITQRGSGAVVLIKDQFNDTTPFTIDGNGNVGVGTSTPNQNLTVFGNLSVSGTLSATMIEAISSRVTYLDIREYELSGFRATGPVIIETNSSDTTLRITQSGSGDVIRVEDETNPDLSPFIITSIGNVGVGTSTPSEKLTVAGNISAASNIFATEFQAHGSNGFTFFTPELGSDTGMFNSSDGVLAFRVNNTEAVRISATASGSRVGMGFAGNEAPQARLHIKDGAIMPAAGNSAAYGIQFPSDIGGGGGDSAWMRYYVRTGEDCNLELGVSNDGADNIVLMPSGNVGVGTTTPNEKLTVTGNISATGTITTSSGNSTSWQSTYTTVNTLSSTWVRGYTAYNGVTALSANWQNTYTSVNANSASWNTTTVSNNNNTTVTLALSDAYSYIRLTNASPTTIAIPVLSWNIGATITFRRTTGAGAVSLSLAGGITVNDDDTASIGPGDVFGLKYVSSNTWDFI